jgi:hypothetical protein
MTFDIRVWWAGLSVVAVFNCIVWCVAARMLQRERARADAEHPGLAARRTQLLLAAVYVGVCAFRSFLPRADVQRICLLDTPLSSVFVGRSVATVAELCFALQWGLFIQRSAEAVGDNTTRNIGRVLFPMIIWAEIASWYAVVSTNFLGNVLEQSTWTLGGALIGLSYVRLYPQADVRLKLFLRRTAPVIIAFIYFMGTVDIPHYFENWRVDQAAGKRYLDVWEGLRDSATRWIVTYDWNAWTDEVAWMSLYFSVGVWVSIAFSRAPLAAAKARALSSPRGAELSVD